MDEVVGELSKSGYDAEWETIPAYSFGAGHRRDRVWIVAHSNTERVGNCEQPYNIIPASEFRDHIEWKGSGACLRVEFWKNQSEILGAADGVPDRLDRLRALGNSVVPAMVEWIGRRLI